MITYSNEKLAELIYASCGCERFMKLKYYEFKCMFDSLRKKVCEQLIQLKYCKFMKRMFDSLHKKVYEQFIKLNYCKFMKSTFDSLLKKVYE